MEKWALLITACILITACEPIEACSPKQTRCNGELVEICGSDKRWFPVMNCREVSLYSEGEEWTCGDPGDGEGHACLPRNEADGGTK